MTTMTTMGSTQQRGSNNTIGSGSGSDSNSNSSGNGDGTSRQKQKQNQRSKLLSITFCVQAIAIGSCLLFQLIWMKQMFVEKERYTYMSTTTATSVDSSSNFNENRIRNRKNDEKENNIGDSSNGVGVSIEQVRGGRASSSSLTSSSSRPTPKSTSLKLDEDQDKAISAQQQQQHKEQQQQTTTLLNLSLIKNVLLREAPWAESHGADHLAYLGAGMLYYSMAYSFRSQTIVVLGSGGGFVPRLLKQAQRDLMASGIRPSTSTNNQKYELYLVDAHLPSAGWGSTFYAENDDNTTMKHEFDDIHYMFQLTDDAYANYFRPRYLHDSNNNNNFQIDYLHIDADHGFHQSWKDFDNYSKLLSDNAIISFHDTCYDNITRNCHTDGVPETMAKLKQESHKRGFQVMDMHYLYRGIAFAIREDVDVKSPIGSSSSKSASSSVSSGSGAIETPRNRRINFCVNNADLIDTTAGGFTKNGRVGSLSTLGDFMECSKRYNITELLLAKSYNDMNNNNNDANLITTTNGIMAIPCSIQGYRRNHINARCEKCIPGMIGKNCQTYEYESVRTRARIVEEDDEDHHHPDSYNDDDNYDDVPHLAMSWLRSLSKSKRYSTPTPSNYLEVGSNAWTSPSKKNNNNKNVSELFFRSAMKSPNNNGETNQNHHRHHLMNEDINIGFNIGDVIVIDPISVGSPLWIDPTISSRYRFLPCSLKDAIKYDEKEQTKKKKLSSSSSSSPLDLNMIDTMVCLSCDDLVMATAATTSNNSSSSSRTSTTYIEEFLHTTFPNLRTIILGMDANEKSNDKFVSDLTTTITTAAAAAASIHDIGGESSSSWRLDRDVTMSLGGSDGNNRKRMVLLTLH